MTNEELIKRFFAERVCGNEESYGFSIKPLLRNVVGNFTLYSKTSRFPMAIKFSKNYFIISTSSTGHDLGQFGNHTTLVTMVAKQQGIDFVLSPGADRNNFQKYMEGKINLRLISLAERLAKNPLEMNPDFYPLIERIKRNSPGIYHDFYPPYCDLLEDIHKLLDEEIRLELPKNQVALLDTDEIRDLWVWLIKDNPNKEDRELLRKMYTLSRLLAPG